MKKLPKFIKPMIGMALFCFCLESSPAFGFKLLYKKNGMEFYKTNEGKIIAHKPKKETAPGAVPAFFTKVEQE